MNNYYYIKYLSQYIDLSINNIIENHRAIELALIEDSVNVVNTLFKINKFTINNSVFSRHSINLKFDLEYIKSKRELLVNFTDLLNTNENYKTLDININHIGSVKSILIVYPDIPNLENVILTLTNKLSNQFKGAYKALEVSFISSFENLRKRVFNGLYDVMEGQFENENKKAKCKYWFFISNEEKGLYYFDSNMMKSTINHFKSNSNLYYSPLELTIWLISSPLPFKKSLTKYSLSHEKKAISKKWKQLPYIEDASEIYLAELHLFNSKKVTVKTICNHRKYTLSIAFSSEFNSIITQHVDFLNEILSNQFEKGLKLWSPYFKVINSLSTITKNNSAAEFLGTFVGKISYTWFKSI